jgi:hypothetical protein
VLGVARAVLPNRGRPMTGPVSRVEPQVSLRSLFRAAFDQCTEDRKRYWWLEVGAASTAVIASFLPWAALAALAALAAVGLKVAARSAASRIRSLYRLAERARRLDFERDAIVELIPFCGVHLTVGEGFRHAEIQAPLPC